MTRDGRAMAALSFMRAHSYNPPKSRRRVLRENSPADAIGCEVTAIELERWADDGGPVRD